MAQEWQPAHVPVVTPNEVKLAGKSGFWKGFILAAVLVGFIVAIVAYQIGVNAGIDQCEAIARDSYGVMQCTNDP